MPKVTMLPPEDDSKIKKTDHKKFFAFTRARPFRVPAEHLFSNYIQSWEFRDLIASGKYIYVDGLFVLRPIAIFLLENQIDIDQFLINKKMTGNTNGVTDYCLSVELQHIVCHTSEPGALKHSAGRNKGKKIVNAAKAADIDTISQEEFMKIVNDSSEPPYDFGKMLSYYMKEKNVTEEGLSELTGISDRTIRRMKRNDPNSRPKLENIVAVCIALHLYPHKSIMLINAAGYYFRNTSKDKIYQFLIDSAYNKNVDECNEFLIRMGYEPLTGL